MVGCPPGCCRLCWSERLSCEFSFRCFWSRIWCSTASCSYSWCPIGRSRATVLLDVHRVRSKAVDPHQDLVRRWGLDRSASHVHWTNNLVVPHCARLVSSHSNSSFIASQKWQSNSSLLPTCQIHQSLETTWFCWLKPASDLWFGPCCVNLKILPWWQVKSLQIGRCWWRCARSRKLRTVERIAHLLWTDSPTAPSTTTPPTFPRAFYGPPRIFIEIFGFSVSRSNA